MTELRHLFPTLQAFSGYAPGVDTSLALDDMQAACNAACKRIKAILTPPVFDLVVKEQTDEDIREPLRMAVANMTLQTQLVFDAVNRKPHATSGSSRPVP